MQIGESIEHARLRRIVPSLLFASLLCVAGGMAREGELRLQSLFGQARNFLEGKKYRQAEAAYRELLKLKLPVADKYHTANGFASCCTRLAGDATQSRPPAQRQRNPFAPGCCIATNT